MAKDDRYLVFRYYSPDEGSDIHYQDRTVFYGWTDHKPVLKAFMAQRSESKYLVKKLPKLEVTEMVEHGIHEEIDESNRMIDFIKLKSSISGEEFILFMTGYEMEETEKQIQSAIRSFASIDMFEQYDAEDEYRLVNIFSNLKDRYADSLYYIGFRPRELDSLFAEDECEDNGYTVIDQISSGYSKKNSSHDPRGTKELLDDFSKIIYSLESFIKVMRQDM